MSKYNKEAADAAVVLGSMVFVLSMVLTFITGLWIGGMGNTVTVTKTETVEVMPWLDHYDYEAFMQCVGELEPLDSEPEKCFGVIREANSR